MTDITTIWRPGLVSGDWALTGATLQAGEDLATAVFISLFSDARASGDDVARMGLDDPRGWWGDTGESYAVGSRIWLRRRAKATAETLKTVKNDIVEALQWLIDDGVVSWLEVLTEWTRPTFLGAQITLHRTGQQPVALNYEWAWQGVS